MYLTFGMYLDRPRWSDKQASMGERCLGPSGMLGLLETRLGLTGPGAYPAKRINQYMKRLKKCDHENAWFHASFVADAWSTAKQMLAWRDELIEAGWKGQEGASGSPRLRALASIEQCGLPLAPGREDRLQEALRQLAHFESIAIAQIQLLEPRGLLPHIWQKIFSRLQSMGVVIEPAATAAHRPQASNLSRVQAALRGAPPDGCVAGDDNSLLLIKAANEWEAAENLALWLSANVEANSDVTIICGADTGVLDQALRGRGLPQLGSSKASRWHASLQLLPLALANAWKPVDIQSLAELLSSIIPLVPGYASRCLLNALHEEPGLGGDAWKKALNDIAVQREKYLRQDGVANAQAEAEAFAAEIDAFLASDRFAPDSGIPAEKLKHRCQWVAKALSKLLRVDNDPMQEAASHSQEMIKEAASHTQEMINLAEGRELIPRVEVERMLDSVIGIGSSGPDRFEQAAPWRVVGHPGEITCASATVIWWGFTAAPDRISVYWSDAERQSLTPFGVELEPVGAFGSREALAWKRGFAHAEAQMLMFYPERMRGEAVYHHPFWDEILNAAVKMQSALSAKDIEKRTKDIEKSLTRECSALCAEGRWQLAARTAPLQKAETLTPATPSALHAIPRDTVSLPETLSYSQMSTMIGCPMKWVLQYHAKLRLPDVLDLPKDNQMVGTFCHKIVQKLYAPPTRQWKPDAAEAQVSKLYDEMVVSMASELLLPGNELDAKRYKTAVVRGIKRLVATINELGLIVEKTEEELSADMKGLAFKGRADLLLRDREGNPFVFDLKWTKSSRYLKEEIEDDGSLQLAVYAWMLRAANPSARMNSGYFMLKQCELLSSSSLLGKDALTARHTLDAVWDRGARHWDNRLLSLRRGELEASGVKERFRQASEGLDKDKMREKIKIEYDKDQLLYQEPACGFCDFANLCGLPGGSI